VCAGASLRVAFVIFSDSAELRDTRVPAPRKSRDNTGPSELDGLLDVLDDLVFVLDDLPHDLKEVLSNLLFVLDDLLNNLLDARTACCKFHLANLNASGWHYLSRASVPL
jgi:hypothetical protein